MTQWDQAFFCPNLHFPGLVSLVGIVAVLSVTVFSFLSYFEFLSVRANTLHQDDGRQADLLAHIYCYC